MANIRICDGYVRSVTEKKHVPNDFVPAVFSYSVSTVNEYGDSWADSGDLCSGCLSNILADVFDGKFTTINLSKL